jgi:exodeoxyribonuclease VII large subunit
MREVRDLRDRARRCHGHRLDRAEDDLAGARARVRALSPLETLRRGYAVLQDPQGHVVSGVAAASPGSALSARVTDGRLDLTVTAVHPDPKDEG